MLRKLIGPALALAAFCAAPAHAEIVNIEADGAWHAFDVAEEISGGLEWINVDGEALSFLFTSAVDVALTVVDASATAGDRFRIFDNGVELGLTSEVPHQLFAPPVNQSFDYALASGDYSFATFILAAGTHTISGELAFSFIDELGEPLNSTIGGLRITPVPLPAAAWLLLSGAGALGLFSRRRKPVVAA